MSDDTTTWNPWIASAGSPDELPLSRDALFEVLSHEYRRRALFALIDVGGGQAVKDLAETVAEAIETGGDPTISRGRLAIVLHHVHLPLLADVGLIEYDHDRRIVEPIDATAGIERYLNLD